MMKIKFGLGCIIVITIIALTGIGIRQYMKLGATANITHDDGVQAIVNLLWKNPENKRVKEYLIYCNGEVIHKLNKNATGYSEFIEVGTEYKFRVEAVDKNGKVKAFSDIKVFEK